MLLAFLLGVFVVIAAIGLFYYSTKSKVPKSVRNVLRFQVFDPERALPFTMFAPLAKKAQKIAKEMTGSSKEVFLLLISPSRQAAVGISCDMQETNSVPLSQVSVGPVNQTLAKQFLGSPLQQEWEMELCDFFGSRDGEAFILLQTSKGQIPAAKFNYPEGSRKCSVDWLSPSTESKPWA